MMNSLRKYKYWGLIKEIALTDFKLKYQGSVLGYLWSLVKPLLLFIVLYTVFTQVFRIGGSIPNYPIYLLLGIVIWNFFSELTGVSLGAIVQSGDLIRKVYFPRIVLVISRGVTALLTFFLNFIVVLIFMAYTKILPGFDSLLLIFIFFELFIVAVGTSFFLSALFVKYRDVAHIWEVFISAFFYATPIIYPLSFVPIKFQAVVILNPMAQIIQDARYVLISHQTLTAGQILPAWAVWVPYAIPFIIFYFGYKYFVGSAAKFAERV
jgi:ABC-2 type transport system permease protein